MDHPSAFPHRAASPSHIRVELCSHGCVRRIDHGDVMINLYLGNETEGSPTNIYLRIHQDGVDALPLIGPRSPASWEFHDRGMTAVGIWNGIRFRVLLVLAESASAWFWHVELENTGSAAVSCDLILTQDLGLAHYGAARLNEYYVSQYVDHTPLDHPRHGVAVASRQNQSMGGHFPWTVIGSLGRAVSYATDALQVHGLATRAGLAASGLAAGLPGKRLQHEHSMAAIQDEPILLESGETSRRGFFAWFEPDKRSATTVEDVAYINSALALPEAVFPAREIESPLTPAAASLFATAPVLEALELGEDAISRWFGTSDEHAERDGGRLLSFFRPDHSHVVLKAKELRVLRPHGHLLRSGEAIVPDESALTSTAWMNGVFHSMITQGHVSINRFLSTCHSYLGLFRSHGQRVFVETATGWKLLDMPSAFEMKLQTCRWIYSHEGGVIEVISTATSDPHRLHLEISVIEGPPCRFLITHHIAMNGDDGSAAVPAVWRADGDGVFVSAIPDSDVGRRFPQGGFKITPQPGTGIESIGGDELLYADATSRREPFLCLRTIAARSCGFTMEGCLIAESSAAPITLLEQLRITPPKGSPLADAALRMATIRPWFIHNALVHYLSPRGLEQYSGGGWGTRDICQGPVELLLALGHFEPLREVLLRVFRQQNPDGDWPQWFMFFERERNIRPGDSHGDIVYWPLLALAQYLSATRDASLLEQTVPFFYPDGDAAESATILQHVDRALDLINRRVISGTRLAAYGHGDWNDSLQPAKPEMRENLCSSWTVTLNYQTLMALADAFRKIDDRARSTEFAMRAAEVLAEFQRVLIVDDVITGLAYFDGDGKTDYLLHPRDRTTGLSYSLLPMIHAIINDMLNPQQAEHHLALIKNYLTGPDGAHLFDKPMAYHGGPQTYFQRAESASFFGREIGIMYMHAHLRYCEALARFGDAEAFFHGLCQANPIGLRELVPSAALRQANCYYSSSDPAFADRYEAYEHYDTARAGEVALEGGWRVYSSGAGISVRLITQCFLGIRQESARIVIDPIIPTALSGLTATVTLAGHPIQICYQIDTHGRGPVSIELNGEKLEFVREPNPYRTGAACLSLETITQRLTGKNDRLTIDLE